MAGSVAQAFEHVDTASGTTSVVAATFTGNGIIACATNDASTASTISAADPTNGTYTVLDLILDTTDQQQFAHFGKANSTASGAVNVTFTWTAANVFKAGCVVDCTGVAGALDQHTGAYQHAPTTTANTQLSGTTGTLTAQPALVVGLGFASGGNAPPAQGTTGGTWNPPVSGSATFWSFGGGLTLRVEWQRVTATTGVQAVFTSAANIDAITTVAVIDETGGAAPTPNWPSVSDPAWRPPQPSRQHDAQWASSQSMGVPVIAPPGPYYEAPQPARESRVLRHEGIFQPVQPLTGPPSGIQFVGHAGGTTSGTLPGFQAGDIAIVWAFRDGSATAPSLPAGWTSITTIAGTTCSARIGFRILQAGDTTIGTWTSATETIVQIYRGQLAAYGVSENPAAATASGVSTTVSYPALTLAHGNGASWVVGFAGHRSIDTTLETPPTGMVARHDQLDATAEAAGHDTKGGVSSWSLQTVAVGGTSSGWVGATVEIAAAVSVTVAPEAGNAAVSRSLRSEGIFQPVQPLGAIASLAVSSFGDAPPYDQSRETNPRVAQSKSAEAFGAPVVPTPKQFGEALQPQTTRRRNDRVTAQHDGSGLPAPPVFTSRYPISISGRKMFYADGAPFRIKGPTSWAIMGLSPTNRDAFLDNFVIANGFNAIECQIPTRAPEMNLRPTDSAGNLPWLKTLGGATWSGTLAWSGNSNAPDFNTPNPAYWASVDALMQACYSRQIMVIPFFAYLGQGGGSTAEGWLDELNAIEAVSGTAGLTSYGTFIGNRFKSFPNIIYGTAGDTASGFDAEFYTTGGIQGVSGQASGPQFTSQRAGGQISTDGSGALGTSTTINGAYDWATVITQCQRAYSASSSIPGFMIEEPYEDEGTAGTGDNPTFSNEPPAMRRYEWWGWLNAIGGYIAGNGYIWRFALTGTPPLTDDYRNHLNTRNTQDLRQLNAFIERWPNTNDLIPGGLGGMRTLVVSGAGTIDTDNFVCAAQSSDGTLLIGYTPPSASGTFSVDLRSMAGRPLKAYWVDPTDSSIHTSATAANTFTLSNSASAQSFTIPSGSNSVGDTDWALVIEAQAAQAGVEVPEQIARNQRGSRATFRMQNADPLPAIAVAPTGKSGFDLRPSDRRPSRSPQPSSASDGVLTAGLVDWEPIAGAAAMRPTRMVRLPSAGEPMPPPPFIPGGFEVAPAGARPLTRPVILSSENLILPPPPFVPSGFETSPAAARLIARALTLAAEAFPSGVAWAGTFEAALAQARPLRARGDWAGEAIAAAFASSPWASDLTLALARARTTRSSPDQDRLPGLAVVTLPAWGFEPEPPRTRSPAADRRLVNGEPLRAPVAVLLTAWGFEPPPAPARGPRQDRRGIAGEPMPRPVLAALTAWFEVSGATARAGGSRIWTPGEPLPAAGPADWVDTAAPAPARSAPRGRAPAGGEPLPLLVLTPWGWESLGAARGRGARIDARSAEASPPLIVSAPAGFDPTAPPLRAPARRRETWAEGLPVVFIPPPPAPWGYEPSSPMTRWVSSARFPLGGDGTTLVIVVLRSVPRARVGGGGTKASGSGGPTRAKRT